MKRAMAITAAALLAFSGAALARHCPKDMKAIDEALGMSPKVSAEQMAEVKKLRAEGETLHKAGRHPESEAVLAKAMGILGIK